MKAKATVSKKAVKGTGGKSNPNKNIPTKAVPSAKFGGANKTMKMGGKK